MLKKSKKLKLTALSLACACTATAGALTLTTLFGGAVNEASAEIAAPETLFETATGLEVQGNVAAPSTGLGGFYRKNESDTLAMKTADDLEDWQKNGVLVTSKTEKNRLTYKNEVDLTGKTKDDVLLAIQPLSSKPGTVADMSGMKIYFTDAADENNWVCVYLFANSGNQTMMQVQSSNGIATAYRYGGYHQTTWTLTQWWNNYETNRNDFLGQFNYPGINYLTQWVPDWRYSMEDQDLYVEGGVPALSMYLDALTIRYDEADKALWVGNACLLDLDHTESVGVGKEFGGFTENRVKISVQTLGITGTSAQYMLYNVAGQGLNGETVSDSVKPYFLENLPEGDDLPIAAVGKEYPLFDVTGYDLVDGAISAKVFYKHESASEFTLVNGTSFTPASRGNYTLRYEIEDASGNKNTTEYEIKAQYGMAAISLAVSDENTTFNVGENVFIPEYEATGGSGKLTTRVSVVRVADGFEMDLTGGYFRPTVAGEYDMTYYAEDYLGQTAKKTVTYTAVLSDKPVFEREKPMYKRFATGIPVELPSLAAYDYSKAGQRINAVTEITVRGKGEYASVSEKLSGFVFTPNLAKFGSEIEIEYKLYLAGKADQAEIRTYQATIFKPEQAYDYLIYDKAKLDVSLNEQTDTDKFTKFTAKASGAHTIEFSNPVLLENFEAQLNAGSSTFQGKAEIKFTDSENSDNTFSLYLKRGDGSSTKVVYNGKEATVSGAFERDKILLSIKNGKVYNLLGEELFTLVEEFEGATARVCVVFHAESVGESLKIKKLGTTLFEGSYRRGELRTFTDSVSPTVVLDGKLPLDGDYGETIVVPAANAYDNISPISEAYVTVTAPDGTVIYDGEKADRVFFFELTQYGTYEVAYLANDDSGNTMNVVYEVRLLDEGAPVIDYAGETTYEMKVGDSVVLSKFNAYDAVDSEVTYKIFVIDTNNSIKPYEAGATYTFAKKGTYTVRHAVYDDAWNYAILDIKVVVS